MPLPHAMLKAALLVLAVAPLTHAAAAADRRASWTMLHNERHGFSIAYPQDVFVPRRSANTEEGLALVSRDGKAQLLVGAFANEDATTLADYRRFVLQESYAGADIEYAPVRGKWFVLSGTIGDREFYERVSFSCGGRLINSWAMVYPVAERGFYNRVVEAVARSYAPGRACD